MIKPVRQEQLYVGLNKAVSKLPTLTSSRVDDHLNPLDEHREKISARVLLAEDNAVHQKIAMLMLQKMGCCVDAVSNGHEAIEAFGRLAYDVVLMDCQMPEMDGYAATEWIRNQEVANGKHVAIIAMVANAVAGDRERCIEAGMDDEVTKPLQFDQLFEVLKSWVS
ncbi:hypothetical protein C2W62_23405 [Candidatus Entotheonella serta]|nr:hypothetical protein C2W62_23405 [Candidatus Entotheonella serta]